MPDRDVTQELWTVFFHEKAELIQSEWSQYGRSRNNFGFLFESLRPINNLSVNQGQVFLGFTSTKLG